MKMQANAASDPSGTFPAEDPCYLRCTGVQDKDRFGNPLTTKTTPVKEKWKIEFTVEAGDSKGRKMWHDLVWVPAGQAGHGMALKALHAFGLPHEGEIDIEPYMLQDVVVKAAVRVKPAEGQYAARNEIAKWYTVDDADAQQANATDAQPDASPAPSVTEKQAAAVAKLAAAGIAATPPTQPVARKTSQWGGKK